jgi:signal peptidase complex subunit 3
MHNSLNRLQTTFGFFTSCAFTIASIIAILSILPFPPPSSSPSASISLRDVQVVKGRPHYYSPKREEYSQIRFDLDADLSSLFTWNTKQVFVYVTANYPSGANGAVSEAVIWDQIIPATQTPFSFQNLKAQYWDSRTKKRNTKSIKAKNRRGSQDKTTTDLVEPGLIKLKNQKPKYQITDPSGKLSERTNATLHVSWNVQPWVGALVWDKGYLGSRVSSWEAGKHGRSVPFTFPLLKGSKPETVRDTNSAKTPEAGSATPVIDV